MTRFTTILIIDDEKDFCNLIGLSLKMDSSYDIECVHTLSEAHSHLLGKHPNIVLLDHNLPDGTGLDFFIDKKELFAFSHVILMTADANPQTKIRASDEGINFLAKPFEMKKIKEMIKLAA